MIACPHVKYDTFGIKAFEDHMNYDTFDINILKDTLNYDTL